MRSQDSFFDVSLVSGTDDLADARSFALLDFNNDGWTDIALMSLNAPRFKLYQNKFGSIFPDNKMLRLRLIGGHKKSTSAKDNLSNRDAIGARVLVSYQSGKTTMFHKQAGEGFGSQNSETICIGCPKTDHIVKLEVRWPSGLKTVVESPSLTDILTVTEARE